MVNGLKFPSRLSVLKPRGTLERSGSGFVDWPFKRVGASRDVMTRGRGNPDSSVVESTGKKSFRGSRHDVRTVNRHRWVRRVASGERVKRGQGTRHNDPVTSEEGMSELVRCTAKLVRIAANRPKRLFSKNTGVCQAAQGAVYTLTPARCRKVKGRG